MPRVLRTFAGALYTDIWFFLAETKAEAGRVFYEQISKDLQRGTSREALVRYVAPLFWCPKAKRLWFEMSVAVAPRGIYPDLVPEALWGGIQVHPAPSIQDWTVYGGKGPWKVSASSLRRGDGLGCAFVEAGTRVKLDRATVTGNDAAVLRLARAIEAGDSAAYPILADALEEAGCTSRLLLDHCRAAEKHHPACWVIRLIRSKE